MTDLSDKAASHIDRYQLQVDGYELRALDGRDRMGRVGTVNVVFLRSDRPSPRPPRANGGVGECLGFESERAKACLEGLGLRGSWTLAAFGEHIRAVLPSVGRAGPGLQWALESAALDLALVYHPSNGLWEFEPGGRFRPVRFILQVPAGARPSDYIPAWLAFDEGLEFRVKPELGWSEREWAYLAQCQRLRVIDLRVEDGDGLDGARAPSLSLYEHVARLVCRCPAPPILEDPPTAGEVRQILSGFESQFSFGRDISSVEDIARLEPPPRAICLHPWRLGRLDALFGAADYCRSNAIEVYMGYSGEIGPGRDQNLALAAIICPEGPNDLAPEDYYLGPPRPGLPPNPLAPPFWRLDGFRYREGAKPDPWWRDVHPERKIKERRLQLGLTEEEVGLGHDMDDCPDEIYWGATLGQIKAICKRLDLDVLEVLGYRCVLCDSGASDWPSDYLDVPRNQMIRRRREELGLSREEVERSLGGSLGWRVRECTVLELEEDAGVLEGLARGRITGTLYSLDLLGQVAECLRLPVQALFGVKCGRCGR